MNNIEKLIDDIIDNAVNGHLLNISAGNNGPYNNKDTIARNQAHWIQILKYKYHKTKDKNYLAIIKNLADEICNKCTSFGNIKCFEDNEIIETNGVIGQAWVIEGLIGAYEVLKNKKYYEYAVKMFLSQKYNFTNHLWKIVNCSGKELDYDYVFNHQLWFAASGYIILNVKDNFEIRKQVTDFTKNINKLYKCHRNGMLCHVAVVGLDVKSKLKRVIKSIIKNLKYVGKSKEKYSIEKGYHLFDVYGFAIIKNCDDKAIKFSDKKIQKVIRYALDIEKHDKELREYINDKPNRYAYPYNSPAFEFPFIDKTFNEEKKKNYYKNMLDYQINNYYNENENMFNKNTEDPNTLTARLYELCKYMEMGENNE